MARLTYAKAGVKIDAADRFIRMIKPLVRSTERPEVLGTIGGFSGLFRPRTAGMKAPVLVSSTDGVGTKLLVAEALGKYDTVGIDLVAMCVDDVVVLGAEPLFFLDYIAVGDVRPRMLVEIVKGIVRGCRQAGCTLIGGETAELPGLYAPGKWDLAGFCVGLVDRSRDHRRPDVPGRGRRHRAGLLRPPQQRLLARPGRLHGKGAPRRRRAGAPPPDADLLLDDPRGPEGRPGQVHGPHHRGRLLRQHPPRHP